MVQLNKVNANINNDRNSIISKRQEHENTKRKSEEANNDKVNNENEHNDSDYEIINDSEQNKIDNEKEYCNSLIRSEK